MVLRDVEPTASVRTSSETALFKQLTDARIGGLLELYRNKAGNLILTYLHEI